MFFEDFIRHYNEQLEALKTEYAAKEAALENANEARISEEKEMLKGRYEQAVADLEADFNRKLEAFRAAHDSALLEEKNAFESFKTGVATREEFAAVEQRYAESVQKQAQAYTEAAQRQNDTIRGQLSETRATLDNVNAKLNELEDIDAEKLNGKIRQCATAIVELRKKKTGGAALLIAILSLLALGALCALFFLGKMPLDKYGYVTADALNEAVAPLSGMQTEIGKNTDALSALAADPCAEGHAFVTLVTVPATETAAGYEIRQCSRCKTVEATAFDQIVHGHSAEAVPFETDPPTLAEPGTAYYHCDTCGLSNCEKVLTEPIPALVPEEYVLKADAHPAAETARKLSKYGVALDPLAVNTPLCSEMDFDSEHMLWFLTNDGRYVLLCVYDNGNAKNDIVNKTVRTISGVSGTWYQARDNKSLLLFVPELPDTAQESAAFTEPVPGLSEKVKEAKLGSVDMTVFTNIAFGDGRIESASFGQ